MRWAPWNSSCSQPGTISPAAAALSCTVPPALRLPHRLLLLDQPVCRCSDRPGLSGSAVIRWCLKGDARRRVRGLRRRRPYHSSGIPSARAYKEPGGGRHAPEQQIPHRTEGENTPIHARVRHGVRACPAKSCKTPQGLGAKIRWHHFSSKSEQFLVNIDMKITILDKTLSAFLVLLTKFFKLTFFFFLITGLTTGLDTS